MNIRADMLDLIRSRTPGYALPRPFYTDPEVFKADMETYLVSRLAVRDPRRARSRRPATS